MRQQRTLALALCLLAATSAHAAPTPRLAGLTGGIPLAEPGAATLGGPLSMEHNPAGLSDLAGSRWAASGLWALPSSETGGGGGAFLALPLGASLVPGVAAQWLLEHPLHPAERFRKVSLGLALGGPALSLGVGRHFFGGATDGFGGDRWDLGVRARPARWLSLAGVVHGLHDPFAESSPADLPRGARVGLALRPLGTAHVTLNGESVWLQGQGETEARWSEARVGLALEVIDGLHLGGVLAFDEQELRSLGVALALQFERLGLGAHAVISEPDASWQPDATALEVSLSGARRAPLVRVGSARVVELGLPPRLPEQPRRSLFGGGGSSFLSLLGKLRSVERDPAVAGLLLRVQGFGYSWAQTQELRAALGRVRAAGRKVWVHMEDGGNRSYLLASAADEISMSPGSALMLLGLAANFHYLGETLAKAKVQAHFVRVGRYKGAPDVFTESRMSPVQREVETALVSDLHAGFVAGLAAGRSNTPEQIAAALAAGPYAAETAKTAGLVDRVLHYAELRKSLRDAGHRFSKGYFERPQRTRRWGTPPRIAVVYVDGVIAPGPAVDAPLLPGRVAGAESICAALDAARDDRSVVAIVLRVASSGGSAPASEQIHHHVKAAAAVKPLIASFGAVAASGGYYVAAPARRIVADPATITGSIGIFAGKFDVSGLLDTLGVGRATVKQSPRADLLSSERGFTEDERAAVQAQLQGAYELFVQRVVEGRKLSTEQVEAAAQGRVWTGRQALEHKLVDELGGVAEAFQAARREAGLSADEPVEIQELPGSSGMTVSLGAAASALAGSGSAGWPQLPAWLRRAWAWAVLLDRAGDDAALALLDWEVEVR